MNLIAIETSAEACSAALWREDAIIERFAIAPRGHSELILSMIDEVLAEGGVSRSGLDGVIFGRGPGSFTGVRIAVGVAQGMAFALDIPAVPVSTLEILAQGVFGRYGARRVLAALDARMEEVYWAPCVADGDAPMALAGKEIVCPPAGVPLPGGGGWAGAGSGWQAYDAVLSQRLGDRVSNCYPEALCRARDAAVLGAARFAAGEYVDAAEALPVYLRNTVAWKKG
jgi:tRNA threonylcarbamoyladenosine biosynthesis protein TsaB